MPAAVIIPAAASGSSALISPFTPDLPAAIPPSAALFEVNARATTLNHRFVFLKLFLVVLYFSRRKMSRASWNFLSRLNGSLMHGQSVSVSWVVGRLQDWLKSAGSLIREATAGSWQNQFQSVELWFPWPTDWNQHFILIIQDSYQQLEQDFSQFLCVSLRKMTETTVTAVFECIISWLPCLHLRKFQSVTPYNQPETDWNAFEMQRLV